MFHNTLWEVAFANYFFFIIIIIICFDNNEELISHDTQTPHYCIILYC